MPKRCRKNKIKYVIETISPMTLNKWLSRELPIESIFVDRAKNTLFKVGSK